MLNTLDWRYQVFNTLDWRFQVFNTLDWRYRVLNTLKWRYQVFNTLDLRYRVLKTLEWRYKVLNTLDWRYQVLNSLNWRFQILNTLDWSIKYSIPWTEGFSIFEWIYQVFIKIKSLFKKEFMIVDIFTFSLCGPILHSKTWTWKKQFKIEKTCYNKLLLLLQNS